MRPTRLLFSFALALLLAGCIPTRIPNPFSDRGGSARFTYGVASGDTADFALSSFSTRYVSAKREGDAIRLLLEEAGRARVLEFVIALPGPASRSCSLVTGDRRGPPFGCSLAYHQRTDGVLAPQQARVRSGRLDLTEGPSEVTFAFVAELETPSGGIFTVRGSGSSLLSGN